MTIRFFVAGVLCFSIYFYIEPFISLWLGNEYIMDHRILVLLSIFIFITNSRGVVDAFNHAHGLYADVWSAWVELILNVSITIVAGIHYGIIGILLGKLISVGFIVILWKPYYLFTSGFKEHISVYWTGAIRYYLIFAFSFVLGYFVNQKITIDPYMSFVSWISYCFLSILAFLFVYSTLLLCFAKGAVSCVKRIKIKKK